MNEEISFEYILKTDNNWLLFKELYKHELSDDLIKEVEKMLSCCTTGAGFATYICPHCGNKKIIPFSCKSKLCSRCGKKYTDTWAETFSDDLLNVDHRHIVLTISDKLWSLFINNPALQKLLLVTADKIIKKAFSSKEKLTPGISLILHPFGDDLKPNFHVHAIVTCGGLSKDQTRWVNVNYIDYNFIRKIWQYEILTALRKKLSKTHPHLNAIIDWCFKYRNNGFVIFADRIIKGSKRKALSYVARYCRHPAISKRRIIGYDGTYVKFTYEAYGKEHIKRMPKLQFIKAVIQHASSKHFKTVRRSGLYARRSTKKYKIAKSFLAPPKPEKTQKFNWRRNITNLTGKDPLVCENCGCQMDLYQITYKDKFGFFKTIGGFDWICEENHPDLIQNIQPEREIRSQIHLSEVPG
jgi:uncharacterized protein (DUF983 family)